MVAPRAPKKLIGQILLEKGLINQGQLDEALKAQKHTTEKLGRILVDRGLVSEKDVLRARAEQLGLPFLELEGATLDHSLAAIIPPSMCQRYEAVPIRKSGNRLAVAMVDPINVFALDDMHLISGCKIDPVLAAPDDIAALLRGTADAAMAATQEAITAAIDSLDERLLEDTEEPDLAGANAAIRFVAPLIYPWRAARRALHAHQMKAPVIRVVNVIIYQALKDGAPEIHIEPHERGVRVRYRVDGVLHDIMTIPKYVQAALVSRMKILANMNVAECELPQEGRIHIGYEGEEYHLHVFTLPAVFGEKIVIYILRMPPGGSPETRN